MWKFQIPLAHGVNEFSSPSKMFNNYRDKYKSAKKYTNLTFWGQICNFSMFERLQFLNE